MVIVCQKCQTRFQLDESRIPAQGARVRCSRCKHAFAVAAPGAHDDTVHRLAADAARTARPAPPEPTVDLPAPARRPSRALSGEEPEDDWQFNIEPPSADGGAPAKRPAPERASASARAAPPRAEAPVATPVPASSDDPIESLFELGGLPDPEPSVLEGEITDSDPTPFEDESDRPAAPESGLAAAGEGWDFSADDGGPVATPASPRAASDARPAERVASPEAPALTESAAAPAERPRRARGARLAGAEPTRAARLLGAAAWLPALALFGFGLLGSVQPVAVERELPNEQVGALELTALRARHLDNYFAGPLLVIEGELRNPGRDAVSLGGAPQLRLTGTVGAAPPPVWLGAALHEGALRERDPRELAAALEHSARQLAARPLRPGDALAVQAVFEAPPLVAGGLRVELAPFAFPAAAPAAEAPAPEATGAAPTDESDAAPDAAQGAAPDVP